MKDFNDIKEGILAGRDATLKAGDQTAKELAFAKEVIKAAKTLDDINSTNGARGAGRNKNEDVSGKIIQKGDLIAFTDGNYLDDDGLMFGIVVELQPEYAGVVAIVGLKRYESDDEIEMYPDCYPHYVDNCNAFILARQKDAINMVKHLKNLK